MGNNQSMGAPQTGEEWLLLAWRLEARAEFDRAVGAYQMAYKLKPELEYFKEQFLVVNGQEYDQFGELVEDVTGDHKKESKFPQPIAMDPQKFDSFDRLAADYLDEHGYVVFSNIADKSEVEKGIELFWKHVELMTKKKVLQNDPSTWGDDLWPGDPATGIFFDGGIGQSEFQWHTRGLPKLKQAFSTVWKTDDLLVSFDGCGAFRPPEYNYKWRTRSGWDHVDQNGIFKKGRHAIQGLMNYFDSGESDGGLLVWPKSIQHFDKIFQGVEENKYWRGRGDFVTLSQDLEVWDELLGQHHLKPVKLNLSAGDFVMWDSRTIHCNHPAVRRTGVVSEDKLRRLVSYICMTPTNLCKDEDVIECRVEGTKHGVTCNHWPHQYFRTSEMDLETPKLTKHQKMLVTGKTRYSQYYTD